MPILFNPWLWLGFLCTISITVAASFHQGRKYEQGQQALAVQEAIQNAARTQRTQRDAIHEEAQHLEELRDDIRTSLADSSIQLQTELDRLRPLDAKCYVSAAGVRNARRDTAVLNAGIRGESAKEVPASSR